MRDGVMQLVKTTAKETSREDQNNPLYTLEAVEAIEVGEVSPVPEMVDADRTDGFRLLTGLTGLADSVSPPRPRQIAGTGRAAGTARARRRRF